MKLATAILLFLAGGCGEKGECVEVGVRAVDWEAGTPCAGVPLRATYLKWPFGIYFWIPYGQGCERGTVMTDAVGNARVWVDVTPGPDFAAILVEDGRFGAAGTMYPAVFPLPSKRWKREWDQGSRQPREVEIRLRRKVGS
jgi:hypothetical protein